MIQQTNPLASYLAHKEELDVAVSSVLGNGRYILGDEVLKFEQEFAAYIGVAEAIGVSNGTEALYLALKTCNIGEGDVVITVSFTAVATVVAIEMTGAFPLLVDIDPSSYTIDIDKLEKTIKKNIKLRLKAIVVVHLYGCPADIKSIIEIGQRYNLKIIEDCAQAHGAVINNKKVGAWGDIAAFSFYPTKNLGALGDGGAVVTANLQLAKKVKMLREYGWDKDRYVSKISGINSRLDELQAAILRVKLKYLDEENERRRQIASIYDIELRVLSDILLPNKNKSNHVYHQYVVKCAKRDDLRTYLKCHGIETLIHYPVPVHLQPAYLNIVGVGFGGLKHAEQVCREILSLPMFPQMTDGQVRIVCQEILQFNKGGNQNHV